VESNHCNLLYIVVYLTEPTDARIYTGSSSPSSSTPATLFSVSGRLPSLPHLFDNTRVSSTVYHIFPCIPQDLCIIERELETESKTKTKFQFLSVTRC
jgi:hypothetical protein